MDNIDKLIERGDALLAQEQYESAIVLYNKVIKTEGATSELLERRGLCYYGFGDSDRAFSDLNQAVEIAPENDNALFNRGLIYMYENRPAEALRDIEAAIKICGFDLEYLLHCALLNIDLKRYEKAVLVCQEILKPEPENITALEYQAAAYNALEQFTASEEIFRQLIDLNTADPVFHDGLGLALSKMDRDEEALGHFDHALKIEPQFPEPWNNRGFSKFKLGQVGEGLQDIEHSIYLDSSNGYAYRNRGLIYASQGKRDLAAEDFKTAKELGYDVA